MGIFCNRVRPAQTPSIDVVINAMVEPNHTATGRLVLLNATTANDRDFHPARYTRLKARRDNA